MGNRWLHELTLDTSISATPKPARRGFTIVELLIVIVIIGLLAALVLIAYNGLQSRAITARANDELKTLATAARAYEVEHGHWAPDVYPDIPPEILDYVSGSQAYAWPKAPWPGSTYDWDVWDVDLDGDFDTAQVTIRFCTPGEYSAPGGPALCKSRMPNEPWAATFDSFNNAYYYCLWGYCRPNGRWETVVFPGYCVNCPNNTYVKMPGE